MDVNIIILQYVAFINQCSENLNKLVQNIEINNRNIMLAENVKYGFYQFIWEILVEAQLCSKEDSIEEYGNGADFYSISSRVVNPNKIANLKIVVNVYDRLDFLSKKCYKIENLELIKFVSFDGVSYSEKGIFKYVLCEDDYQGRFLFNLKEVNFIIKKI